MEKRIIEEVLELIWTEREKGVTSVNKIAENADFIHNSPSPSLTEDTFKEMEKDGLIHLKGDIIAFTDSGRKKASNIVRRHRLSEVLFSDVFEARQEIMEASSCSMEHILNEEVTDRICTFLGHPPRCPHGNDIPRGECCHIFKSQLEPLVVSLANAEIGADLKVVFINSKDHSQTDKLLTFGVRPGKAIHLHQKVPSFIIKISQTELAIDKEIAKNIYVKQNN